MVWWLRGAGTAFVISILFYLFGAVGAGDVKLLSAAAGFLGMESLGILFAGTLLIGGVWAVIYRIRSGAADLSLRDLAGSIRGFRCSRVRKWEDGRAVLRIPLAPAILGAVVICMMKGG